VSITRAGFEQVHVVYLSEGPSNEEARYYLTHDATWLHNT
jgi:hypothetical protein